MFHFSQPNLNKSAANCEQCRDSASCKLKLPPLLADDGPSMALNYTMFLISEFTYGIRAMQLYTSTNLTSNDVYTWV